MAVSTNHFGKARKRSGKRVIDTSFLQSFLDKLEVGVTPTIHINGPSYATALVAVDFGQPLVQARLSSDENSEMTELLRDVARDIINGRESTIRINHDGPNGVYWASLV